MLQQTRGLPPSLHGLNLKGMAESVLPFRTAEYIAGFCEKLLGEGIGDPADLLVTSAEALETKLSTHGAFNYIEMADTISLRSAVERAVRDAGRHRDDANSSNRRPRSRSPCAGRRRSSTRRGGLVQGRGRRVNNRGLQRIEEQANHGEETKPLLWAAVEKGDKAAVLTMLQQGANVEEKYKGWTPFLKAAEEGCTEIMRHLLDRKADMEATNKKGRSALSFAAAPSSQRATAMGALRLLLERGANKDQKDHEGFTARQRAEHEKRLEAVAIFQEFEAIK